MDKRKIVSVYLKSYPIAVARAPASSKGEAMREETTTSFAALFHKWQLECSRNARIVDAIECWPVNRITTARQCIIVRAGGDAQNCHLLMAGIAARAKLDGDGRQQILSFHFPGDFVDFHRLFGRDDDANLLALTAVETAAVPLQAIRQTMLDDPRLAAMVSTDLLADAAIGREWLFSVGRRNAAGRLAHLLCEISLRLAATGYGNAADFECPFTQGQFAEALGLTAVHVNRTLRALQEKGLISYGQQHVAIRDLERLRAIADFDPTYLSRSVTTD